MKRLLLLAVSLMFVAGMPLTVTASDIHFGVNINVPPPFGFDEPSDLIVVPGTSGYVYMVPDTEGVYFYNGYWFRTYGSRWYRSRGFGGPWNHIRLSLVPRFIIDIPPDYYRYAPSGYYRVPYRDFHRSWRSWERDKHWNRYDWYRNELRDRRRWDRRDDRDHFRDDRRDHFRDDRRDDRRDHFRDDRRDHFRDDRRDDRRDHFRDDRRYGGRRDGGVRDGGSHGGDRGGKPGPDRGHGGDDRRGPTAGEKMQEQRSQNPMYQQQHKQQTD